MMQLLIDQRPITSSSRMECSKRGCVIMLRCPLHNAFDDSISSYLQGLRLLYDNFFIHAKSGLSQLCAQRSHAECSYM